MDMQQENALDARQYQMLVDHDNTQVNMVMYSVFGSGEVLEHYQLNKDGTLLSLYGTDISEAMEQFIRKLIAFDAISVGDTSAKVLEHVTTTFGIDESLTLQFDKVCDDGNTLISTIWRVQEEEQADEDEDGTPENFITQITENVYIRVVHRKELDVVFFIDATEPEANFRLLALFNSRHNALGSKEPINIELNDIPAETATKISELINTLCENNFSRDYLNDNFEILTGEMVNEMFNKPE